MLLCVKSVIFGGEREFDIVHNRSAPEFPQTLRRARSNDEEDQSAF